MNAKAREFLFPDRFTPVGDLLRQQVLSQPERPALRDQHRSLSYLELDQLCDRIASALQRDGIGSGQSIGICALNSVSYAALFLGALRAGVVVAPIAPSSSADAVHAMLTDAGAEMVFVDAAAQSLLAESGYRSPCLCFDVLSGEQAFCNWLAPAGSRPAPTEISPTAAFNIIYSSGTTGTPKGIVQSHAMRWAHIQRGSRFEYSSDSVTLLATPLYSNTTLVVFFPTLAYGGCVLLMEKFHALQYLQLAQQHSVSHTMLVPVQYQRIMAVPEFGQFDLHRFRHKFCTSAPFKAALKADVLARWPGGLIEFYGMTEGGGTCILLAHEARDKLHTVGKPAEGNDIRLIDEQGREVAAGETGEVVGHSPGMMTGYHNQPGKTAEAEWYDSKGKRFIRTGDIGKFDEDGFLVLMDRRKDMIISGGFNVYPSDLEAILQQHPAIAEAAVVGVPSEQWGETPVAYIVGKPAMPVSTAELLNWFNARCGKTQRLSDLKTMDELPRSAIGKILKRELRERYLNQQDN